MAFSRVETAREQKKRNGETAAEKTEQNKLNTSNKNKVENVQKQT